MFASHLPRLRYTGTAADATCPKCAGEMYQRDDDKPETIKNRLDVYEKSTSPLVDYYRGQGLLSRSTVTRLVRPCTGCQRGSRSMIKIKSATQIEQMKKAGALSKDGAPPRWSHRYAPAFRL